MLKVLITHLLLVLEVCNVKPTYTKSWAGHRLVWSDLTFLTHLQGPNNGSFALVSCLSGGYKFASVIQYARSSFIVYQLNYQWNNHSLQFIFLDDFV